MVNFGCKISTETNFLLTSLPLNLFYHRNNVKHELVGKLCGFIDLVISRPAIMQTQIKKRQVNFKATNRTIWNLVDIVEITKFTVLLTIKLQL